MFINEVPDAQSAASTAGAQSGMAQLATPHPVPGPSLDAARAGVAPSAAPTKTPNTAAPDHMGAGENVALMVVGGAALVTGLLIGGNGGAAIAIGGAVIGLYGLFNYMK